MTERRHRSKLRPGWNETWRESGFGLVTNGLDVLVSLCFGLLFLGGAIFALLKLSASDALSTLRAGPPLEALGTVGALLGGLAFVVWLGWDSVRSGAHQVLDLFGARRTLEGSVTARGSVASMRVGRDFWVEIGGERVFVERVLSDELREGMQVRLVVGRFTRTPKALHVWHE